MSAMRDLWRDWGTIRLLEEWALWINQPANIELGYGSQYKFIAAVGVVSDPKIDDELGGFIHDTVNEMGRRFKPFRDAIVIYYIGNKAISQVAREMGMSRDKARQALQNGETWIDAKLHEYFKMKLKNQGG